MGASISFPGGGPGGGGGGPVAWGDVTGKPATFTPTSPQAISFITDLQATLDGKASTGSVASKQDTLVSGTNLKSVNSTSLLGSGNLAVGDVLGQASSVDNEVALFSGTGGKTVKRATATGLAKLTSGVLSAAVAGTDYLAPAAIGVTVQALHANLTALAGLTGAADKGIYFTGAGAQALFDLGSQARTFLAATTQSAQRTALGLSSGTLADGSFLVGTATTPTGKTASEARTILKVSNRRVLAPMIVLPGTAVTTGNNKVKFGIPAELNGYIIVDFHVFTPTPGTTGTMDVMLTRQRGASTVDVTSTAATVNSGAYDANDSVINTSNDDLATGDMLGIDIDAIHTTPAQGLGVSITIEAP